MENNRRDCLMETEIDWELDLKTILQSIERILKPSFDKKGFAVERNPKESQMSVNIFPKGTTHRDHVISIWPHNSKRKRNVTINVKKDYVLIMQRKANLPLAKEVRPGRCFDWDRFDDVTLEKTTEMLLTILEEIPPIKYRTK